MITDNNSTSEMDAPRKSIKAIFDGFDGEYAPANIDWGEPVGEEIW